LKVQIPDRSNLAQRCQQFATASIFTQAAAVLPWPYDVEMGIVKGNNWTADFIKIIDFAKKLGLG